MNLITTQKTLTRYYSNKEQGSALLVSLIFLVVLTILGLTALNSGTTDTQISSNLQQAKTAFYSAQSGANAYTNQGNTGNDLIEPGHVLAATRAAANTANFASTNVADALTRCAAANGTNSADCDTTFLQANFKARTDTWYRGCNGPATECPGFSLGVGTTIPGCHRYQVQATGWIDLDSSGAMPSNIEETQVIVDQWLSQVALCPSA
jgi:Tfp pilus assembly protein PilX